MPTDRTAALLRDLLARQLESWLPGALNRSRRATVAYVGDADGAAAALAVVAAHADRLRGRRLTVLVLADAAADLPARLGPLEAGLPAEVTLHVLPGTPERLPVAVKAAGAAGAPLFCFVAVPGAADPAVLAAAANGRAGELLLYAGASVRDALTAAGFPLVTEVELVPSAGTTPSVLALATRSDRSLDAVKEALWAAGATAGLAYRDPADPQAAPVDATADPDPEPLAAELLAELRRRGPLTVTELRRHAATATVYRAADATGALTGLLDSGALRRERDSGRLAGDEVIASATT
ncbi:hypothetical protein ACFOW4_29190 [Micromonospora sp. GCM10011542]|uniref:hypothetical protein n=1 Tax=Micromonospora sp. GCM10011542 TaxID=3317337 RepID=UPI00360D72DA